MPPPPEKRPGGPERLLLEEAYVSLMLFGRHNPVLDTMRSLCAASHLERGQNEVGTRRMARWCGGRELKPPAYPMGHLIHRASIVSRLSQSPHLAEPRKPICAEY